jgi:hypothetical protein
MSDRLVIRITRSRLSLQPLRDPLKPPAWDNNDGNNSLDQFGLYADDGVAGNRYIPLFTCRAQTVCNLEGLAAGSQSVDAHYSDTIAPGPFQLRAFVDPRAFWCTPHGVCNTQTLAGDTIGPNCVTRTNPNRWLMHDWRKLKPQPDAQDCRVAWSAGCIVVADADLERFSQLLLHHGITPGDLISGEIIMEA